MRGKQEGRRLEGAVELLESLSDGRRPWRAEGSRQGAGCRVQSAECRGQRAERRCQVSCAAASSMPSAICWLLAAVWQASAAQTVERPSSELLPPGL